ncbi:MAG: hypothetical protein PHU23_07465 [Dehalococcoidales bacterium]|nr:hypothetical protein [Dehalococcoidales bacterium]
MAIKTDSLLEILEIAMNSCCCQHNPCEQCRKLASCISLWSRACEQSSNQSLTSEQLKKYVEEFNHFITDMSKDCRNTKPKN